MQLAHIQLAHPVWLPPLPAAARASVHHLLMRAACTLAVSLGIHPHARALETKCRKHDTTYFDWVMRRSIARLVPAHFLLAATTQRPVSCVDTRPS